MRNFGNSFNFIIGIHLPGLDLSSRDYVQFIFCYFNPTVTENLAYSSTSSDFDLNNHKKTIHHWCFICFSSHTCEDNLKDHFTNAHSKNLEDLDLALGKAPR